MVRPAKAQIVRLLDAALIGPVMSLGGVVCVRSGHRALGYVLFGMGVGTVLYNAANHEWIEARQGGC